MSSREASMRLHDQLALFRTASWLLCLPLVAGSPARFVQEEDTPRAEASYDDPRHPMGEVVDLRSVLAALGLLSGTFLTVLLGLRVYLHCLRRRPQRESRRKKMTEEEINNRFPVTQCETAEEETCVVCLSAIEADDKCRVTQCGHAFHADCLLAWWLHKPKRILRCPICRTRQRMQDKKRSKVRDTLAIGDEGTPPAGMEGRPEGEASPEEAQQGQEEPPMAREAPPRREEDNCEEASAAVAIDVAPEEGVSPAVGVVVSEATPAGAPSTTQGVPVEAAELFKAAEQRVVSV